MSSFTTIQTARKVLSVGVLVLSSLSAQAVIQKSEPAGARAASAGKVRLEGGASMGAMVAGPLPGKPFKERTTLLGETRFREGAESYRAELKSPSKTAEAYRDAMAAWREAAAENHPRAYGALAWMRLKGLGEPADVVEAEMLAERALALGAPRANTLLSLVLAETATDENALAALEQEADRGDGVALNELGVITESGRFQAPNTEAAKSYYRRSAALGVDAGRRNLQRLTSPEPTRAEVAERRADLLRQSALSTGRRATYELGVMAHRGDGMTPDYMEALRLYRLSASRGEPRAQAMLSLIFSRSQDGTLDATWMRELALVSRYRPDLDVRAGREPVRVDVMEEFILKGIKP